MPHSNQHHRRQNPRTITPNVLHSATEAFLASGGAVTRLPPVVQVQRDPINYVSRRTQRVNQAGILGGSLSSPV
jgi:hypothetical protein